MKRLGGALVALLFAIPFGGVGVGCTWAIFKTLQTSSATSDWVKVKAEVIAAELVETRSRKSHTYRATGTYVYEFQGRKYQGSRLAPDAFAAGDNIGSWQEDMGAFLKSAKAENRPITVWVDPQDPTQAMVDRSVRWGIMALLVPFALIFGAVGVGALFAAWASLTGKVKEAKKPRAYGSARVLTPAQLEDISGSGPRWWLVIIWNAIAWPVALWVLPSAFARGEYGAVFILVMPLIGTFMAWVAVKESWRRRKVRAAREKLDPGQLPRSGSRGDSQPSSGSPVEGQEQVVRGGFRSDKKKKLAPGEQA